MHALVLPFPLARRRDLVDRQAQWFAAQSHQAAERNLKRQLQVQRETLLRRGVSVERAETEVATLQAAIRHEVSRHLLTPEVSA